MKMTFRWYGAGDPVSLQYIRQIPGMSGIVSAVYDVPVGEEWGSERIGSLKHAASSNGLEFEVVESVPVHEDIKLGTGRRDYYIENYIKNIRALAKAGVKVICYNFMPVFDWTRTQLDKALPDGSTALVYYIDQIKGIDPKNTELSLPGWDSSYKREDLNRLFEAYEKVDEEKLWENLCYFLSAVIPEAKRCGVKMAIHPDDPPYPIFGLPRIITCEKNLDRFLKLYDDEHNGLTFCTGSLGCADFNDIPSMLYKYSKAGRVHFLHLRNVKLLEDGRSFEETAHLSGCGSLDIVQVLSAAYRGGFDGYIRPDHGRMIWGETGRPGYGLYDRALGATYINGIWEAISTLTKRA